MRSIERLLRYVAVPTQSDEACATFPSSDNQFALADLLCAELRALGVADAVRDEYCYVYGHIPATLGCETAPRLAFLAHMDTAPDFSGEGVRPLIWEEYDGGDLPLGESGRVLSVRDFPHLKTLRGRTLITTDGTTLLGADDKAGVAEIMTAVERIFTENIPHGPLCICFTPDEEVGAGTDRISLDKLGADFGYTVDGGAEGGISYENFHAAAATVEFFGVNVHPGDAKDIMVNAALLAMEFNSRLPAGEIPARTEGREGFYHLIHTTGTVERATLEYIVRDHDAAVFAHRLDTLRQIARAMQERYGEDKVRLTVKEQYRNMLEKITPCMHLIHNAEAACRAAGVEPRTELVRGGTDGARLSFMGLPCPNLGTGGYAFHGPYEHITAEGMDIATEILVQLVRRYSAPQP